MQSMDEITKHHFTNIATGKAKENEDGSLSTVYTRQVDLPDETGKRVPTLIPSVYDGKILSEEDAVKRAVKSGKKWPTAKTHEELRKFDIKIHKRMKPISAKEAAAELIRGADKETVNMNEGGMTLAKQMELFEPVERGINKGGLMDEGGMVDEESGNEVPPGSLREEVRDDIPAQLSEGEFVFPADVVRYIGLENLMRMRQEAKQGLAQMEAMGQMGNSEEATIPDDLPFDVYDLELEDEEESNSKTKNYQVGGYVPPFTQQQPYQQGMQLDPNTGTYTLPGTGIAGYMMPSGGQTGYTPYGGVTPYFQPLQFTGPQYTTATQTTNLPTFAQTVGSGFGQYDEFRTYVNDAGQVLRIPFKDGNPLYPIPEGFFEQEEGEKPTEEVAPTEQRVETTQVRTAADEGGGKEDTGYAGATIALGGEVVGKPMGGGIPGTIFAGPSSKVVNSTKYSVAYEGIPGGIFNKQFQFDLVTEKNPMPPGSYAIVGSLKNPAAKVTLPGVTYNKLRNDPRGDLSKSIESAIAAVDRMKTSDGNFSYEDGELSYKDEDGNTVSIDSDTLDVLGESFYKDIVDATKDGIFSKGDDFVDIGKGLTEDEKKTLSAFNDSQFADFFGDDDKGSEPSGPSTGGGTPGDPGDQAAQTGIGSGPGGEDRGGGQSSDSGFGSGDDMGAPVCLTENMKVKLNGVIDFVTNVKVGDIVDNTVVTEVLHKHMREGYYVVNGELEITNDHPVLANGSWKRTEDLVLGDYINNVEVTSLEYVEQVTPTVYIGTADDRYDVYTEGEVYTVHGQYKNITKQAA